MAELPVKIDDVEMLAMELHQACRPWGDAECDVDWNELGEGDREERRDSARQLLERYELRSR